MKTIIKCRLHDLGYMFTQDHLSKWIEQCDDKILGVNCPKPQYYTIPNFKQRIERLLINKKECSTFNLYIDSSVNDFAKFYIEVAKLKILSEIDEYELGKEIDKELDKQLKEQDENN